MSQYIKNRAQDHTVTHQFSGRAHFFNVESPSGGHTVSIQVNCDCTFMGIQGQANSKICSHVYAALKEIIEKGQIDWNDDEASKERKRKQIQAKVNACLQLVRIGNRKVNQVRVGDNEGAAHRATKEAICEQLERDGKNFVTEANFKTGGRADILVLDDCKVIEIADSEEDPEAKREYFPEQLNIEVVRCS